MPVVEIIARRTLQHPVDFPFAFPAVPQLLRDEVGLCRRVLVLYHPGAFQREPAPQVARSGHFDGGLFQQRPSGDVVRFLQKGGIHEAEPAAARADLFLHPHDIAQKEPGIAGIGLAAEPGDIVCQIVHAFDADPRYRRMEHHP